MKKKYFKILKMCLIFLILYPSNSFADFRWTKIVTSFDGATEFYIDKNSVRKVGKFHYYWMMSNYLILEEGDNPNVKSTMTSNILNCKTKELKSVSFISFNLNKARGQIINDVIIPDEDISYFDWEHFGKKTSFGAVFKEVCKTK